LRGAPPGDLYIFLAIKPHRFFQRDGASIYCHVPLPMTTAALGGNIEVTVLRSNTRGDMYIQIAVETPVSLTKKQQELLREFESAGKSGKTSPQSEGFFTKVKEFWEDLTE
jgi:molecular chaperone DnaJ